MTSTRTTRQRAVVLSALADSDGFRSAQDLHRALVAAGHRIGLTTVYRAVQRLADAGDVDVVTLGGGERLYRRCERGAHHHNLVCRQCGTAREVDLPALERAVARVAAAHGFTDTGHTVEIFGRCPDCPAAG